MRREKLLENEHMNLKYKALNKIKYVLFTAWSLVMLVLQQGLIIVNQKNNSKWLFLGNIINYWQYFSMATIDGSTL